MRIKWGSGKIPEAVRLDDEKMTAEASELETGLQKKIIDQDRAIKQFVRAYENWQIGMSAPDKPLANLLFLGPTGVGKTHLVEAFCEQLWGNSKMILKVDCSEYQHSHETAKLIGSPPGYIGYNSGAARLSQEILEEHWKDSKGPKISVILFDEIEKADPDFFQLILGLLDKGFITLGNGTKVDMRKCVVVMTSNLGAKDVSRHLNERNIGFLHEKGQDADQKIYETSMREVKRHFSPEFVNRLDRIVVFRSLTEEGLRKILDLELDKVQDRILSTGRFILLSTSRRAKDFLLKEGTSAEYGARELRRAIERFLVSRVTRLIATRQAKSGDMVLADYEPEEKKIVFHLQADVVDIPTAPIYTPPVPEPSKQITRHRPGLIPTSDGTSRQRNERKEEDGKCARCGAPWSIFHYCPDMKPDIRNRYGASASAWKPGDPLQGCGCEYCCEMRLVEEKEIRNAKRRR